MPKNAFILRTAATAVALAALAACASNHKPTEQMAVTSTTVHRVAARRRACR